MSIDNYLSIIAIVISIASIVYTYITAKRVTQKTLNKDFFEKIYFDYIIVKIPEALLQLEYKSELVETENECTKLNNLIQEVLNKSIFYKFFDKEFYENVRKILIELDELTICASEPRLSTETFREYKLKITESINSLYKVLKDYYSKI